MSANMVILAHRANLEGPRPGCDNGLEDCCRALELGLGLETDLRRDLQGRFYISHDPGCWTPANDFAAFEPVFRKYADRVLAMNVNDLGYEQDLIQLHASGALGDRCFYFDFELLEPVTPGSAQRRLKCLPGGERIPLASRLSDRGEPLDQCLAIPAEVVWADEFDSLWITGREIDAVKKAGRKIFLISPELHGFPMEAVRRRWADFRAWGVDGVCTDYSLAACDFFLG
ncbi:MAG: hypothetical protein SNJ84_05845 [Verrucomicrobiia bacterium]